MKTKFETNVATQIPKTRMTQEPNLPWEVRADSRDIVSALEEKLKFETAGQFLLGARPVFLVILLVSIFISTVYAVYNIANEGEKIHISMREKEKALSLLQANLKETVNREEFLKERSLQLERAVADLRADKELFTTVIQDLTKKSEKQGALSGSLSNTESNE